VALEAIPHLWGDLDGGNLWGGHMGIMWDP
jgi:hypothetical protein